jgi:hypothetical protein
MLRALRIPSSAPSARASAHARSAAFAVARAAASASSRAFSDGGHWHEKGAAAIVRTVATAANKHGPLIAAATGSFVIIYGISSLALHLTGSFLSLTLTDAVKVGFGAGFASAGVLAAGGLRAHQHVTLRPEAVFQSALAKLAGNERVAAALGASVKPGTLKAYNLEPGHFSTQRLGWVDPRVSMLFQVVGSDTGREGMVRARLQVQSDACKYSAAPKIVISHTLIYTHADFPRTAYYAGDGGSD